MTVLEQVAEIRERDDQLAHDELAAERKQYFEIAVRDALGKSKESDADDLVRILQILELTDASYQAVVNVIPRICDAAASVDHLKAAADTSYSDACDARRKSHEAAAESDRQRRLAARFDGVSLALGNANGTLRKFQDDCPALFDALGQPRKEFASLVKKSAARIDAEQSQAVAEIDARFASNLENLLRRSGLDQPVASS